MEEYSPNNPYVVSIERVLKEPWGVKQCPAVINIPLSDSRTTDRSATTFNVYSIGDLVMLSNPYFAHLQPILTSTPDSARSDPLTP